MQTLTTLLAILSAASLARAVTDCRVADVSAVAHEGTPTGKEEVHNGVNMYIARPPIPDAATKGILYLTDVFGIQLAQNRLLADSFARAGYLVVAPDLFGGQPAPGDINVGGFNTTAFLALHGPAQTDPLIKTAVDFMRGELKLARVGATGYCFGGRYSFRAVGAGGGADVAFAAHPSLLEDGEIAAVKGPVGVAAAETDSLMPPERRSAIEAMLQKTGLAYTLSLYSGTQHGFGVRANISDPKQKFGKEQAFFQAVRLFDAFL